jgi:chromosome segregation ATPase
MSINQPNATYWDKTAQLEDRLRELEANLERLAERLDRIEHAIPSVSWRKGDITTMQSSLELAGQLVLEAIELIEKSARYQSGYQHISASLATAFAEIDAQVDCEDEALACQEIKWPLKTGWLSRMRTAWKAFRERL